MLKFWATSGQTTVREHSATHQQKVGLKIYWAWSCQGSKTQFSAQPVPPIRKLAQTPYPFPSEGRQKKQELQSHSLQNENHNPWKLTKMITWITALCNSVELWDTACRATQDRWVMVESSDKTWSPGEGNGKLLQYACFENPRTVWKGKKIRQLKMSPPDQFSHGRVQLFVTPMDCSTPGFPVHHQLRELAQTHVHWVSDAIPHLILCCPLLLLPSIFPSIRVFSSESALLIRWPKYCSFCFSISPSNEYSGLISFRIDWFDVDVKYATGEE